MSGTPPYTIDFDPATNDKLMELAHLKGEAPEAIIAQAVDAFITFNAAFTDAVNEGLDYLSQEDAKFVPHDEVMADIRQQIKSRQATLEG